MAVDEYWLVERMLLLIPLILSLSVHEWAHAACAAWLGDPTPEREGRLTLNPLSHIDPVGTLLLPLLGVPFGWAKPVPINPACFHRGISMRWGVLLTAIAGPLSNLVIAITVTVLQGFLWRIQGSLSGLPEGVTSLLNTLVGMNVALAVFNMLPIPPLDGSRVVDTFVGDRLRPAWDAISRLGPVLIFAVLIGLAILGPELILWPLKLIDYGLQGLLRLITS